MHNASFRYDAKSGKLIIEVDVSNRAVENAQASKSGKTKLVASTGGFVGDVAPGLAAGLKVALNVTIPQG